MGSASEPTPEDLAALGEPRPLEPADVAHVASAIARAFAWHEPWGPWGLPDESTREQRLRGLIEDDIRGRFLDHGECWTIGRACTTLWFPPLGRPGSEPFARRRFEEEYAYYGDRADAMRAGDDLITSLKPDEEHWYLDTIATAPRYMRMGLGGRLLDHDLAIRDAAGDACALDTHTRENIDFYGRRGFEVIGSGSLPEGGPSVYMMFRPARGG